jgi:adenosylmethionine-8-amino-7-oxononanoate aminotransferase
VADRATRAPFPAGLKPGKLIERAARERGLILRCGADFVALSPPLIATREEIDEMCDLLDAAIAEVQEALPLTLTP